MRSRPAGIRSFILPRPGRRIQPRIPWDRGNRSRVLAAAGRDPSDYDDWDRRFATIARLRKKFDRLDSALGASVDAIEEAAAWYSRTHRQKFEYLRKRRPYDPIDDSYGARG